MMRTTQYIKVAIIRPRNQASDKYVDTNQPNRAYPGA